MMNYEKQFRKLINELLALIEKNLHEWDDAEQLSKTMDALQRRLENDADMQ